MQRWVAVLSLLLMAFTAVPLALAAQPLPTSGSIRAGGCTDLGQEIAVLTESSVADGPHIGSRNAIPGISSFSSVPVSLEELTAGDHSILVPSSNGDEVLACGEIGGIVTGDGALIVGIRSSQRNGVSGVAYLSPGDDPSQTNISLFLAGEQLTIAGQAVQAEQPQEASQQAISDVGVPAVDEQPYIDEVVRITKDMTQSFQTLSDLMATPLFGDETWSLGVAAQFAIWQVSYDAAQELNPPPAFSEVHVLFVESLRLYAEAGAEAAEGLDTFDVDKINRAAAKMSQAQGLMEEATALVNEIAAARNP